MSYFIDSGYTSLNHVGEELCGDRVECAVNGDYLTAVLCDGMGSGVKANILATLSSKILCTMLSAGVPIRDCIETLIASLPVCKERGVAYATFSVCHINREGKGELLEFDNPAAILIRDGEVSDLPRTKAVVCGKNVYTTELDLRAGDAVIMTSDGVEHAGIGMLMNFGWERPQIKDYLKRAVRPDMSARAISATLAAECNELYMDMPGDDTTVLGIKVRNPEPTSVFVGPPMRKEDDAQYVKDFMALAGKKVVCGGTSSQIVARHLGKEVTSSIEFPDRDIPPIGYIDGIDLTTEGVVTVKRVLELSEKYLDNADCKSTVLDKRDGATLLARMLFEGSTEVNFFVGQAQNHAHDGLPIETRMKLKLIDALAENLKKMGKTVNVRYN
ncbi:MAG: SpoIIE family protein phosphatase [Clostridiales bacterium]|nr:SpoIIE family protein phosphatase [Clostridiales bacterium]